MQEPDLINTLRPEEWHPILSKGFFQAVFFFKDIAALYEAYCLGYSM